MISRRFSKNNHIDQTQRKERERKESALFLMTFFFFSPEKFKVICLYQKASLFATNYVSSISKCLEEWTF